jgi:dihydrofolate reductase
MKVSLVVAIGRNNEIGKNGDLLWRLPKDMQRFKEITWGHYVLMGRKTFESIPAKFRPLPGRPNIVISSSDKKYEGCFNAKSVEEAIELARQNGESELMIIGGGKIYEQTIPVADKIYLTIIQQDFEADTFFPKINLGQWGEENKTEVPADEKHQYAMTFVDLVRKKKTQITSEYIL